MEKKYEVSGVFKDGNKAFGMLKALEGPICIIVYGEGDIKFPTYRHIVDRIKKVIPVMFETAYSEFAEEKFKEGRNVILKFTPIAGGASGHLHETIIKLRQTSQGGSLVGIFIQQQATAPVNYAVSSKQGFDYTISIR